MPGKETIILVDITQPQCVNTYGVAPCTASLGVTGTRKCFNGRATCQDSAHYNAVGASVTNRFSLPNDGLFDFGPVIPVLSDVPQVTPPTVNLAGSDQNASALGTREKVTLRLMDFQHSDLGFDKYRLERSTGAAQSSAVGYDPYWRGTFWRKWKARNPYYISYPSYSLTVYRGYAGDAISTFDKRTYVIDSVTLEDGKVTIIGKDVFTKLDDRKAVAPAASLGVLQSDITNVATSATLSPAGIGNLSYPTIGYVRMGDECAAFTRVGDVLTLTRQQLGTVADSHSHDDTVQLVLAYSAKSVQFIMYDLLTNYTEVPTDSSWIGEWDLAAANGGLINQYTTYITEPTPVADLIGELCIQAGVTLFPDTRTNKIKFIPLTAATPPFTVTDDWIVGDTLKVQQDDTKRVSQSWMYYGMKDFTRSLEETTNYATRVLGIDLGAEDPTQYGTSAVRQDFSRWIPQFGRANAQSAADRIISTFRDPPVEATYEVHKDRASYFTPASIHALQTDAVQEDDGSTVIATHAVLSAAMKENTVQISTMAVTFLPPNNNRDIYVDVDTPDVVVRSVYDLLYAPATGVENIRVFVNAAAYASTTSGYGLDTGLFPAGCTITITINGSGRICGAGGKGNKGGDADADGPSAGNGTAGSAGGPALKVRQAITLAGSGEINGGGGAGGAGGGAAKAASAVGGTGGSGGRGISIGGDPGIGTGFGFIDGGVYSVANGYSGYSGALSGAGPTAPSNSVPNPPRVFGGVGGAGGDWGQTGSTGGNGSHSDVGVDGTGAAGGAPGAAVEGNSFITWQAGNTVIVRGALT